MPVCWSEATKLMITATVLVQVWPALEFSYFHFLLYITMTPALHYVFYKGKTIDLFGTAVTRYFLVMHSDPGIVPINKENQNNTIIELCEKDEMDSTTICTESMMKRPLRSKYDRFSKKLIAKFDHYCPWVNNAVGAGNHKVSFRPFRSLPLPLDSVFCTIPLIVGAESGMVCLGHW